LVDVKKVFERDVPAVEKSWHWRNQPQRPLLDYYL